MIKKAEPERKPVQKSLSVCCTKENLSRSTYYSDVFTKSMRVDGVNKPMDVTHISIPFEPSRERAVMEAFGISSKEEMEAIYAELARGISNNVNTSSYLASKGVNSVVRYVKTEIKPKRSRKGVDIYLVTEHLRTLRGSCFNQTATVSNILLLGARLSKLIRDINQVDQSVLRVIDPDQIYVNDEGYFVFGCFSYSYIENLGKSPIKTGPTAPLHTDARVARGEKGDIGTDMSTLCSFLWALLNGSGFDQPTPTGTPPQYATAEIAQLLEFGMKGDPESFSSFRKQLNALCKQVKQSEYGAQQVPVPDYSININYNDILADLGLVEMDQSELMPEKGPDEQVAPEMPEDNTGESVPRADEPAEQSSDEAAEAKREEEVVFLDDEDDTVAAERVSAVDTTKFIKENPPEMEMESDPVAAGIQFEINYYPKRYILKDWLMALLILAVMGVILYVSVKTHLISLW